MPEALHAFRHGHAQLSGVRLHFAEPDVDAAGRPLVLLLHGFPELWYAWRHQLPALASAGFRAVAPDMRGYNLSDKPERVSDYRVEVLADDVAALIEALGHDRATVIGHDWGGIVAWFFAMRHPSLLERLVVMNAPHPHHFLTMMRDFRQLRCSWYITLFQLPWVAERAFEYGDFAYIRTQLQRDLRRDAITEQELEHYARAWRESSTTKMNYYRALIRRNPFGLRKTLRPIEEPVQVIWGARDRYILSRYAEPPAMWVPDLRLDLLDGASHWVQTDRPERVNELLLDFLPSPGGAAPPGRGARGSR
jgi:epoxide hydrolase 4